MRDSDEDGGGRRTLRVLALDGGGLRGIFSLRLLLAIEERCRSRIQDLFDYAIGTSTGGLIALALFAKQLSVRETMALYDQLGTKAFVKKLGALGSAHSYDHTALEALLRDKLGEESLTLSSSTHYVAVVAHRWDRSPNRVALVANYPPVGHFDHVDAASLWEAARATSAAPTCFEPASIGDAQYVDGGLVANNPTLVGFAEATALGRVSCVVSVGTGRPPSDVRPRDANPWIWTLAQDIVAGSLEASADLQHVVAQAFFDYLAIPFIRLDGNVKHPDMDDVTRAKSWLAAADELLRGRIFCDKLHSFCDDHLLPPRRLPSDDVLPAPEPEAFSSRRRMARHWLQDDDDSLDGAA